MGLVTAQLLFVEQLDATAVRLDVIVLDRVECAASPEVGAPLAFGFGLPDDEDDRERVLTLLRNWERRGVVLDMAVHTRRGVDEVELRCGVASLALHRRAAHGTP